MITGEVFECVQIVRQPNFADLVGNWVTSLKCDVPSDPYWPGFWVQLIAALATGAAVWVAVWQSKSAQKSAERSDENATKSTEALIEANRIANEHIGVERLARQNEALSQYVKAWRALYGRLNVLGAPISEMASDAVAAGDIWAMAHSEHGEASRYFRQLNLDLETAINYNSHALHYSGERVETWKERIRKLIDLSAEWQFYPDRRDDVLSAAGKYFQGIQGHAQTLRSTNKT